MAKTARARRVSPALRERMQRILDTLDTTYPESRCSLDHKDAFQLLIATILSAQCTDARVNLVTPKLFGCAPNPKAMAKLSIEELEELVKSTGFFRNKAKSLSGTAKLLTEEFGGVVPDTMEELLTLPGVARKTANCVLGTWYGKPVGIVVDTHVTRIANLLHLTKSKDAKQIERDLMPLVPESHRVRFTHQLIDHGRAVCIARRPQCDDCTLAPYCPSAGKALKKPVVKKAKTSKRPRKR